MKKFLPLPSIVFVISFTPWRVFSTCLKPALFPPSQYLNWKFRHEKTRSIAPLTFETKFLQIHCVHSKMNDTKNDGDHLIYEWIEYFLLNVIIMPFYGTCYTSPCFLQHTQSLLGGKIGGQKRQANTNKHKTDFYFFNTMICLFELIEL